VLLIRSTPSIAGYVIGFCLSAAWVAAFGILVSWYSFRGLWYGAPTCMNDEGCRRWKALEGFAFAGCVFWLLSGILVRLTY
jgi:hypothetical protein